MVRQRVRFRFRKQGAVRLIGHRDLIAVTERLLRRAGVRLAMSQGFHPKPKMNFPSALSLGIRGLQEILELELSERPDVEQLLCDLRREAPEGLEFLSAHLVSEGTPKPRIESMVYEIYVPEDARTGLENRITRLLACAEISFYRAHREVTIDLRPGLKELRLEGSQLQMRIATSAGADPRPQEILAVLELEHLLASGQYFTRTELALESNMPITKDPTDETGNADQCRPTGRMPDRDC